MSITAAKRNKKIAAAVAAVQQYLDAEKTHPHTKPVTSTAVPGSAWRLFGRLEQMRDRASAQHRLVQRR